MIFAFKASGVGLIQAQSRLGSRQLLWGKAIDNPPDVPTHHLLISANTPQPRYSGV